ncbi:segregation and condensation protein A [Streptomyces sp. NPDC127092]|uniref:segregation and condensation protein A n=1 Tax=Streptomyces sp. NPDC127092 TaxID=3347135 RepID=UPI00364A42AB
MPPPPPSGETSRPARRRALGRGPGTLPSTAPTPAPSDPAPAPVAPGPSEAPPLPAPAAPAHSEPAPAAPAAPASPASSGPPPAPAAPAAPASPASSGPPPAPVVPATPAPSEPAPVPSELAPASSEPAPASSASSGPARAPSEPSSDPSPASPDGGAGEVGDGRFTVRLANFEGPFDLLLQLIAKHKLDVTEVALSKVTDEFMAHIRAMGPDWDLDQTTEFLVVAATLLDLKAARLLPAAEVEDEADLALLEARDLLFARLLQYRAYKQIADIFGERWEAEGRRYPRTVGLEPQHAELLPEVVISIGAEGFARLAVKAMQPKARPEVYVDHIHAPLVSVREQAAVVVALLREKGTATFRELVDGVDDTLTVVARFLALLELYREKAVALDQETALGDLTVSWTGGEADPSGAVTDEFDQEDAT